MHSVEFDLVIRACQLDVIRHFGSSYCNNNIYVADQRNSGYVRTPIPTPKRKIIGWRVFRHLYIVGTGTRASGQHVDRFCGKCCLKMCVQVFKIYSAYRRLFTQNSINRCSVPQQLYQYILGKVFYRVRVMHDT